MNQSCERHETVVEGGLVLQALWDRLRGHDQILFSPLFPAVAAFLTHMLICAPFFLLDSLGCVCRRIRLCRISDRDSRDPPHIMRRWLDCFRRILFNYLKTILPATALFQSVRSPTLPDLAPSCWKLFVEVFACLLLFDTLFYFWHYSMHRIQWLYQNIHQVHHHTQVPFALAAQDASSVELLSLLFLALGSAWVVGSHPLSEVLFHLINSWLAAEDHCGYDLPWSLHRLLPCLGGAPHHQAHHLLHRGNYAPYFTHWDHVFGTYIEGG